ncbi:protein of unknown function [Methanoculleus bourgensis]|uniref:Uncharacterized protein n=1 Tax=Methanoculleus bourgensis TaxID=83986 RepID=A0A0X3BJA4_9EURY|nr:protein of unknown function [Methanoculleus bourgensis]
MIVIKDQILWVTATLNSNDLDEDGVPDYERDGYTGGSCSWLVGEESASSPYYMVGWIGFSCLPVAGGITDIRDVGLEKTENILVMNREGFLLVEAFWGDLAHYFPGAQKI